jgi:hypothetical protein
MSLLFGTSPVFRQVGRFDAFLALEREHVDRGLTMLY